MKKCSFLPLSRPMKVLRNILIAAVIAVPVWGEFGFPLPTAEMEFRRLERMSLLDNNGTLHQFAVAGEKRIISVSSELVNVGLEGSRGLFCYPVKPEGMLIPVQNVGGGKGEHAVLAVGVAKNAVSARLELELAAGCYEWVTSNNDGKKERVIFLGTYHEKDAQKYVYRHFLWNYKIKGEQLDNGLFLFRVYPNGEIENSITGEVMDLAEWKALDEIKISYVSRADNRGLTRLVFRGTFYNKEGGVVQTLRLAPLEELAA